VSSRGTRAAVLALLAGAVLGAPWPAAAQAAAQGLSFQVYRERIEPIFLNRRTGRHGPALSACVSCHVHSGTPFKLEPLTEGAGGSAAWTEQQSRRNLEALARLVVPGRPEESRLLLEPLGPEAGGPIYHAGGVYWRSREDPEWRALADWVRAAAPGAGAAAAARPAPTLDFTFFRTCVQKVFLRKRPGLARCVNCHDQAPRNFALPLRPDQEFWSEEESRMNFEVARRLIEPGNPTASRFLMHPLAHEAGGDPYHAGGRHWRSQDDWVRGESPRCVVEDATADPRGGEEQR
jgi:hypothetical protein